MATTTTAMRLCGMQMIMGDNSLYDEYMEEQKQEPVAATRIHNSRVYLEKGCPIALDLAIAVWKMNWDSRMILKQLHTQDKPKDLEGKEIEQLTTKQELTVLKEDLEKTADLVKDNMQLFKKMGAEGGCWFRVYESVINSGVELLTLRAHAKSMGNHLRKLG